MSSSPHSTHSVLCMWICFQVAPENLGNDNLQVTDKRLCLYVRMCLESRTSSSVAVLKKHSDYAQFMLLLVIVSLCFREKARKRYSQNMYGYLNIRLDF